MAEYIQIGWLELGLAALLLVANVAVSAALRLGMGRRLVWAGLRMTVQLLLVGMVLEWIFAQRTPGWVLAAGTLMAALAGIAAVRRTQRRFAGIYWNSLVSVMGAAFVVTGLGVVGILRVEPWYEPQYTIPLLGMVLGNSLTGISLALDRFMDGLVDRRGLVETWLALGASRWEAAHEAVREAVRTGMIPILNAMLVMGIVSLPGMMTGQILAGAAPADAVRYQIVIVFMIAASVALAVVGVVLLAFLRLFSADHRLRTDRLWEPGVQNGPRQDAAK